MSTDLNRRDSFDDFPGRLWNDAPAEAMGASTGITTYLYDARWNLHSVDPPVASDEPQPDDPHFVQS
jgi:hypothetical protein